MKKLKAKKIRKVWVIKPKTRIKESRKKDLLERVRDWEAKEHR